MSIIEQAAKRLEELRRGGVEVPWAAAGLARERMEGLLGKAGDSGTGDALAAAGASAAQAPAPRARESRAVEIDLARLAASGYLVPSEARSALAMEFRHIKRPLLKQIATPAEDSGRARLVMVTSAIPGEGKTFCAINLAMSIAMEVDSSVLLVDGDVVRPSVMDRLGLREEKRGLLDVLTDPGTELADVLLRTNVPKLSLLPSGTFNTMSTELLASGAMDRLLQELATRYSDRVVVIDAPPLLVTTEARVLANRVGQVLVVVDSMRTHTNQAAQAFGMLENCPVVVSVLNKCMESAHKGEYEYKYV